VAESADLVDLFPESLVKPFLRFEVAITEPREEFVFRVIEAVPTLVTG
jgi:hypothetical protein